jgi:MFS transporter, DHA1 family, multidrug resistance protein
MPVWKRNMYILMVSQFLVLGSMTMIMPFLPLYLKELGMTDPKQVQLWAGLIFGINFLSQIIVQPIWGNLADRYGRKMMILRSGFGMSVAIFLMSLATSHWQLFFLRLLNGVVSGFIPASISLMATNSPKEKSGYVLGMLQAGATAGSIIGPFMGGVLAELVGYRNNFIVTSAMLLTASLVVLFAVKEEKKPDPSVQPKQSVLKDGLFVLNQRTLLLLFGVGLLLQFANVGPTPLMSLFVDELGAHGHVAFFAGLVTAMTGISNMLSSPVLGRTADRYGSDRVLFMALIASGLLFIPHMAVTNIWQLLILRFLLGLCVGGLLPSLNTLIRRFSPPGKESTAYGFYTSANSIGNLLGPICYGAMSGWFGIRGVFPVTGLILILNAFWFHTVMRKKVRDPHSRKAAKSA